MAYTGTAAAWPWDVALDLAIRADVPLLALLAAPNTADPAHPAQPVWSGAAPTGAPLSYIVLGTASEGDARFFGQPGSNVVTLITAYVAGQEVGPAKQLWGELHRVLHARQLPLNGHVALQGWLDLVAITSDPSGQAQQIVARFTGRTVVG